MSELAGTNIKSVAVVGLGYIGLPTAAVLAREGLRVIGVDVKAEVVDAVNAGQVPFTEPDLEVTVAGAVSMGRFSAQTTCPEADAYIVAVPTPFASDKTADLKFIRAAARNIAPKLHGGELVILESTSPPGTTKKMAETILESRPDLSLDGSENRPAVLFAHCPERVLPGRIMTELVDNDRIVGGLTEAATEAAATLYETFCKGDILRTDAATAEMAKLAENAFRDVNIAFANELSMISSGLGIDVWELINLANRHPRVNILQPGPGVGGHCIAVDPWFIVSADRERTPLIRTAREVNDSKPEYVIQEVLDAVQGLKAPKVAVLGLAFKANVDDFRESPAVAITARLAEALPLATIAVAEPHADQLPKAIGSTENITLGSTDQVVADADVTLLLVDHSDFRSIEPGLLEKTHLIDTRGFWRDGVPA